MADWEDNERGSYGTNGQRVDMTTALNKDTDSMLTFPRGTNYVNLTADTLVLTGAGKLVGIFVASSSSGTIKIWDNTTAASTVLVNTFSAAAATYYQFPNVRVGTGIYVDVGGTIDCTVFYDPTTT